MHPQLKKVLKYAFIGFLFAFCVDWFISDGESRSVRICFGLMVGGAGAVTGALLAANFSKEEDESDHAGHGGHGTPAAAAPPTPPQAHGHGH